MSRPILGHVVVESPEYPRLSPQATKMALPPTNPANVFMLIVLNWVSSPVLKAGAIVRRGRSCRSHRRRKCCLASTSGVLSLRLAVKHSTAVYAYAKPTVSKYQPRN
jgi:hypothetical protein